MNRHSFEPGDVITRTPSDPKSKARTRRFVVQDPAYTSRGKLRLMTEDTGVMMTTHWSPLDLFELSGYRWSVKRARALP